VVPSEASSRGTKPGRGVARLNHCTIPSTPLKPSWEAVPPFAELLSKLVAARNVFTPGAMICESDGISRSGEAPGDGGGAKLGVVKPRAIARFDWELGTGLSDLVRAGLALVHADAGLAEGSCGNHCRSTGFSSASAVAPGLPEFGPGRIGGGKYCCGSGLS